MQTCNGWPNGIASRRKLDPSHKKAISVHPCAHANPKENDAKTNLHQLALGGQMVKHLNQPARECELDQSKRKLSQVHASSRLMGSQIPARLQLVMTCDFVWPGFNR